MNQNSVKFSIANRWEWTRLPIHEITCKNKNFRINPGLVYKVTGLVPEARYYAQLRISKLDNRQYKFDNEKLQWVMKSENNEPWKPTTIDLLGKFVSKMKLKNNTGKVVMTGAEWMSDGIDFSSVPFNKTEGDVVLPIQNHFIYTATVILTSVDGSSWEYTDSCQKFIAVYKPLRLHPAADQVQRGDVWVEGVYVQLITDNIAKKDLENQKPPSQERPEATTNQSLLSLNVSQRSSSIASSEQLNNQRKQAVEPFRTVTVPKALAYKRPSFSIANDSEWTMFPISEIKVTSTDVSRIRPCLAYRVAGLNPEEKYSVQLKLERLDSRRHVFCENTKRWLPTDFCFQKNFIESDKQSRTFYLRHESGRQMVKNGEYWMQFGINFLDMKISTMPYDNSFVADPGHPYAPILILSTINGPSWEYSNHYHTFMAVDTYSSLVQKAREQAALPDDVPPAKKRILDIHGVPVPENVIQTNNIQGTSGSNNVNSRITINLPARPENHQIGFSIANFSEWTYRRIHEIQMNSKEIVRIVPNLFYRVTGLIPNAGYYAQIKLSKLTFHRNNPQAKKKFSLSGEQMLNYPIEVEKQVMAGAQWMTRGLDFTNIFLSEQSSQNTFLIDKGCLYVPTVVLTLVNGPSWVFNHPCQLLLPVTKLSAFILKRNADRESAEAGIPITKLDDVWFRGVLVDPAAVKPDSVEDEN